MRVWVTGLQGLVAWQVPTSDKNNILSNKCTLCIQLDSAKHALLAEQRNMHLLPPNARVDAVIALCERTTMALLCSCTLHRVDAFAGSDMKHSAVL